MENFFLSLYRFFAKNRSIFWVVFVSVLSLLSLGALNINLEENITKFFPDDERVKKVSYIFQNSAFAERIVVMVSVKDSSEHVSPDTLVSVAESLAAKMETDFAVHHAKITSRIEDDKILEVFNTSLQYLPVFLTPQDYQRLDSITQPEASREVLRHNYQQLISPSGIALKKIIVNDPMGFSFLVLKKLQNLQYDDNFELYDNYIITKDHRHLVLFIQPGYLANETGKNADFTEALNNISETYSTSHKNILVSYFGAAAVAVGNAQQLKKDTFLTLSLLVVLLGILIIGFFRDVRVLPLMFVPVIFGSLFALCFIFLFKGSLSILALAAGSIILGIAINYALHFLVDLSYHPHKEQAIKDLVNPLTLGSATTVLAFFSLQFTNAAVLKDIGLFAGLSLIGAALSTLIFLPHLTPTLPKREPTIDTPARGSKKANRFLIGVIFLATPVFLFFAGDVKFNSDMNDLNFMDEKTREAQRRLESINPAALHSMYYTSEGNTLEEALRTNEKISPHLDRLAKSGVIKKQHSLSDFLISDSLQLLRIQYWKDFWTAERKETFYTAVKSEAATLKFSPTVIANIDSVIDRRYTPIDTVAFNGLKNTFFADNIIQKQDKTTIITLINALPEDKEKITAALAVDTDHLLDRQMITKLFIEFVHEDFTFIVTFTSILVFMVLLISTGRLELTIITFTPMLITWIWILGIMALVGIEFNIINVMLSTFIFGLGDDFSIFVMDGLLQRHKTGKQNLHAVRAAITLSALATIFGLGVLIFAEHPALRSIAAISIIGIVSVFIMAQTVEPFLFEFLISNRTRKGYAPMTARGMLFTFITYFIFVFGSFILTFVGLLLKAIPFQKNRIRLVYHSLIQFFTGLIMNVALHLKKKYINLNKDAFAHPGVIIANHSSFLDILLTTMLHPKLILLTNQWVWKSPIFGGVVRLADYYPVMNGAEEATHQLKARIAEGYSVVVFPEGTRSADGTIGRFHKGAFYIAEQLQLPVYPLMIYGVAEALPKSTIYVNDAHITLKLLPAILPTDTQFGDTYSARAKRVGQYFRQSFEQLTAEERTPESLRHRLYSVYRYKGPVLEWYLRIKLKLEDYYKIFNDLVPRKATVLDLGCGYGFLAYMLQFLSEDRVITGVDYDEEKISVAQNGYLLSSRLHFHSSDITRYDIPPHDVIILADVLHYLEKEAQYALIKKCFDALNPSGKIIIREGNADLQERHKGTQLTEFFSVKLLKFNKSNHNLNFLSGAELTNFAVAHGYQVEVIDQGKLTSNVIFVISK